MRVLAIDPGTSCGWALSDSARKTLISGAWNLKPRSHEGPGMRFIYLRRHLYGIELVDQIIFEEVRRHQGTHAAHIYGGLVACIQEFCECHNPVIPYGALPIGQIKQYATGNGRASKPDMLDAAMTKWPEQFPLVEWRTKAGLRVPKDKTLYDIADALWILETGLNEYERS